MDIPEWLLPSSDDTVTIYLGISYTWLVVVQVFYVFVPLLQLGSCALLGDLGTLYLCLPHHLARVHSNW